MERGGGKAPSRVPPGLSAQHTGEDDGRARPEDTTDPRLGAHGRGMTFRTYSRDSGSLNVGSVDVCVGDWVHIVGEEGPRRVTYRMGTAERGNLHVACRGTGKMPLGDVEFTLVRTEGAVELPNPVPVLREPTAPAARPATPPPPAVAVESKPVTAPTPPALDRGRSATLFDVYLMIDWSAASAPTRSKPTEDAVWVAEARWEGAVLQWEPERYYRTRRACIEVLAERLADHVAASRKVLIGFDFPFGYPAGLAQALALEAVSWKSVWNCLANPPAHLDGAPENQYATVDNGNNRFAVAAALNRAVNVGAPGSFGPFHGCPARHQTPWFKQGRPPFPLRTARGPELRYWRHTDQRLRDNSFAPLSTWWVLGARAPTVGGQALTGIPAVHELVQRLRNSAVVWPFETGFTRKPTDCSPGGRVVFAEIWPGIVNHVLQQGMIRDAAQVRAMALWAAEADASQTLPRHFDAPAGLAPGLDQCTTEEGWILGVG